MQTYTTTRTTTRDAGSALEPRSGQHHRQASQQTIVNRAEDAGSQTEPHESEMNRHRASQCPDTSDWRFHRLDVETAMDTCAVVDELTAMDITVEGAQTAHDLRAPAATGGLLVPGAGAVTAELGSCAADDSSPAVALAEPALGAAVSPPRREEVAQLVAATTVGVQTEQPAAPSTTSLSTDAALALLVRQLVASTSTGPAQHSQPRTCSTTAQTDTAEAALSADAGLGAAHVACGSTDTLATPIQPRVAAAGGEPADCLQISGWSSPAVVTGAQQLTLTNMEAATPRPRQEPATAAPTPNSICMSPDNPTAAAAASTVPSTAVSLPMSEAEPDIPGTPRRNIYRRLWRSGRTSEWADLIPRTAADGRALSCCPASSAPESQISTVDSDSSCGSSTTATTGSHSVSSSTSSHMHGGSSACGVPPVRTAACQISDAAVSDGTTDDSDICIVWDSWAEAC